ncbi:MAG: SLBB domain-containing protein [Chitinispirillaceae bacterium]|jgi:polysaccharide export outer membrane protein|nr:SLBB domain-containing protein [Chitinispirillaceae bacterium]
MNFKPVLFSLLVVLVALPQAAIIKVGSMLDIQVVGHSEFSGRYTVNENSTIEYPLLADAPITNMTTSELMSDLTMRLARHIDNPLVLVSLANKPEITVTVLGMIPKPGPVVTYPGVSLQEVIWGAGGPLPDIADLENVKIIHKTAQPSPEKGDLKIFFVNANLDNLPELHHGDIVIVPSQQKSGKIKVIGAVQKPGMFPLEAKTSLFEMIYLAGGPAEKADLARVRRISQMNGKTTEEVINVQSFIDKGQMNSIPDVSEGDVIIVYTKWFDGRTFMSILTNVLLLIVTLQAFGGVFK